MKYCRDRTNIIDIGIDITDVLRINDKVTYVLFNFLVRFKVFAKLITLDVDCIGEPFLIRIPKLFLLNSVLTQL